MTVCARYCHWFAALPARRPHYSLFTVRRFPLPYVTHRKARPERVAGSSSLTAEGATRPETLRQMNGRLKP
jgi:hypothetical protein